MHAADPSGPVIIRWTDVPLPGFDDDLEIDHETAVCPTTDRECSSASCRSGPCRRVSGASGVSATAQVAERR